MARGEPLLGAWAGRRSARRALPGAGRKPVIRLTGRDGLDAAAALVGGGGRVPAAASAARPRLRVLVEAVVERLDAELVPGTEQLPRPAVPDREGVHAAEVVHH